jgi:carbon monoxide dehydrogenase subunit G
MKVSGTATLNAPREAVWKALNDPSVLVRTIPGCQRLEATGQDEYRMTISAGVASIKGVYEGQVSLTEQQPLETFVLKAAGSGAPGTVSANVLVTLAEGADRATTLLTYDADAIVGGMLGGVGQRMLSGVAKKTAGEFFGAVDDVLCGRAPSDGVGVVDARSETADTASPGTYLAPQKPGPELPGFAVGVGVGALAALAGAIVGGLLARRRR